VNFWQDGDSKIETCFIIVCFIRLFNEAVYSSVDIQPQSKRPLGKPRRRWDGDIKIYLEEVEWGVGLDLSGSC
jgi:hypothetical protein